MTEVLTQEEINHFKGLDSTFDSRNAYVKGMQKALNTIEARDKEIAMLRQALHTQLSPREEGNSINKGLETSIRKDEREKAIRDYSNYLQRCTGLESIIESAEYNLQTKEQE